MRTTPSSLYDGRLRQSSFRGIMAALLMFLALVWIIGVQPLSHSQPAKGFRQLDKPPHLDIDYHTRTDFDIVLSMYREDPAEVALTITRILNTSSVPSDYRIWIYIKADDVDIHALASRFPPGRTHVIKRPNIGRDSETHLHHILSKAYEPGIRDCLAANCSHNFKLAEMQV
ncbi:hypothetical protein HII31_10764 [Pseudocercospora fuligena]|uniref:Uncharacterized protein n=1 Tax=Pseudocercospora fuligena TaxID=685502 RepID=A0A8H6RBF4_9PEZI|nr:hypothetical protein HII31_10764 [Pseudocercospora fuligena]